MAAAKRSVFSSVFFRFFYFIHTPCYMILSKKKWRLLLMVFKQRVKNIPVCQIRLFFLQQQIWLVYMLDLHWVMWSFEFPHGKYICAIWRHGIQMYQQIVGIPMGTNCAPLITDLLCGYIKPFLLVYACFWHFWNITSSTFWLSITDEGLVPEMRISSIL